MENIKLTLKAARVNKKLNQKEASTLLGISKDTLGKYERGKSFPDILVLQRMEEVYGVKYDNLIFYDNE